MQLTQIMINKLRQLESEAVEQNKIVDYETMTLIEYPGWQDEWPEGDNKANDPEQNWDKE